MMKGSLALSLLVAIHCAVACTSGEAVSRRSSEAWDGGANLMPENSRGTGAGGVGGSTGTTTTGSGGGGGGGGFFLLNRPACAEPTTKARLKAIVWNFSFVVMRAVPGARGPICR